MREIEEWRDIKGYGGQYQVSNLGNVKSLVRKLSNNHYTTERILKPRLAQGYFYVNLYIDNTYKSFKIHRLVAEAFIPNPNNLPCVNHKDEDKTNNKVSNLEWCTHLYNSTYGTVCQRISVKNSKSVYQYTLSGEFVKEWKSIKDAKSLFTSSVSSYLISAVCSGKRKSAYGYIWRYKT